MISIRSANDLPSAASLEHPARGAVFSWPDGEEPLGLLEATWHPTHRKDPREFWGQCCRRLPSLSLPATNATEICGLRPGRLLIRRISVFMDAPVYDATSFIDSRPRMIRGPWTIEMALEYLVDLSGMWDLRLGRRVDISWLFEGPQPVFHLVP